MIRRTTLLNVLCVRFNVFHISHSTFHIPHFTFHLSLFTSLLLPDFAFSYSVFSGAGLGEQVYTSPKIFELELPSQLTFECSFRGEFITTKKGNLESQTFDFTFPYCSYFLPLPKKTGIELSLSELLNLNYELEDTVRQFGQDSVRHIVKGKGSANSLNFGFGKKMEPFILFVGGFTVFGSATEERTSEFINLSQSFYDTLTLNFEGKGGLLALGFNFGKLKFSGKYFTSANLTNMGTSLPSRLNTSLLFTVGTGRDLSLLKIGGGIEKWFWRGNYNETTKYSVGCELSKIYVGFYTTNWYYGNIDEKAGCLGIKFPFASLCDLSLNLELGQRGKMYELEEMFYRLSIALCGKEEL